MSLEELQHPANEEQIRQQSMRENAEAVELAERCLGYLTDGLNLLPRPTVMADDRAGLILQLIALGFNSLRWSFEISLKGYYTQANMLSRSAWEAWMHGAYLHVYRERDVADWLDFKKRPKPREMRDAVAMRSGESGASADDFRRAAHALADSYADYSHPSSTAVRVLLNDKDGETWLRWGGDYDGLLYVDAVGLFCLAASLLSTLLYVLLPAEAEFQRVGEELRGEIASWRERSLGAAIAAGE